MTEKSVPDEAAIIQEILERRRFKQPRIPAYKMAAFKSSISAEIERSGTLQKEFVEELLRTLKAPGRD